MPAGTGVVANLRAAVQLYEREVPLIEWGTINDQCQKNLLSARCEGRYALTVPQPAAVAIADLDPVMAKHDDGSHEARRERFAQGLPPDVSDPAILASYLSLRRSGGEAKAATREASPKAIRKGGGKRTS